MGGDAKMMEVDEHDPQNDICNVCGLRRWWHEENEPRHGFILAEQGSRLAPPPPEAAPTPMQMGDPILRAALVRCGVLNEMQITEAEAWVRESARQGKALVVSTEGYELKEVEVVAREVGESASTE